MQRRPHPSVYLQYLVLVVMTSILVLQKTKQAMLPASQTRMIWTAVLATFASILVLRSGWGRDSGWSKEQSKLGTLANNFYEPRRAALVNGFAVGLGALLSLGWAVATWAVVLGGMRHHSMGRGLLDFEIAALAGALTGGTVGAAIGLAVGHVWEMRHRRRRAAGAMARAAR
jgi:hypothetical protein